MPSVHITAFSEQLAAQYTAYVPLTVRLVDDVGVGMPSAMLHIECPIGKGLFPNGFADMYAVTDGNGFALFDAFTASGSLGLFEPLISYLGSPYAHAQFTTIDPAVGVWLNTVSGANQAAAVSTPFANPLVTRVTNAINQPVAGWPVVYTAQVGAGGATAVWTGFANPVTVSTDGSGLATSPPFSANGSAGTYWIYAEAGILTWQMIYATNGGSPVTISSNNALAFCEV